MRPPAHTSGCGGTRAVTSVHGAAMYHDFAAAGGPQWSSGPMPNRLAGETSPYLRQHADNPVDWYPWGREALDRARREDRPILLSIGYAACHWCHVMAHESFEDAEIARVMNEMFVNIKVDREERPDVDSIYMQAVQSMTGHGGWPMTVFLTPAGEPFYAGTYFPPEDRQGLPSFARILRSVADAYHTKRDRVTQTAAAMRDIYAAASARGDATGALGPATLDRAYRALVQRFDSAHGGFEGAPKFPQTMSLDFLLRYAARTDTPAARTMVTESFRHMAPAASTIRSAAASTATRSTRSGSCRISRRCSTTMPCSDGSVSTCGRTPTIPRCDA